MKQEQKDSGKMEMEKVTIVMATYNGAAYLKSQIDSILTNTYTNWTLEICDDGSTDETISIIKAYVKTYPERIFLRQNSQNLGVVRNFLEGACRASGDYIMFADQDDVWLPDKIAHTLKKMKETEQGQTDIPAVVFTDAKVVDEKLQEIAPSFHKISALDTTKTDLAHLLMENKLIGCTMMFNQAAVKMLYQLPKQARYHDWWLGLIAASMGKIGYLSEGTLLYRQHGNNEVGTQSFLSYVKARIRSLQAQKQSLIENQKQAAELLEIYQNEKLLSEQAKEELHIFASLSEKGWISRRKIVLRHGYLKTGVLRNIGIVLLI